MAASRHGYPRASLRNTTCPPTAAHRSACLDLIMDSTSCSFSVMFPLEHSVFDVHCIPNELTVQRPAVFSVFPVVLRFEERYTCSAVAIHLHVTRVVNNNERYY